MSDRDGATVHVDLRGVPAHLLVDGERLGGEGLVGLDDVEVLDLPACPLQAFPRGRDGAGAHHLRVDARAGEGADLGKHRESEFLGLLLGHDQAHGRTIVEPRRVAGGDAALLGLECWLQLPQLVGGGVVLDVFINLHWHLVLACCDWDDLYLKLSSLLCCRRLPLRFSRKSILRRPVDAVVSSHVLGCDAHMVVVESAPQAVLDHCVGHLHVAHPLAIAALEHHVRTQRHVLLAPGNNHAGLAARNGLRCEVQRLEAASAHLVDCHRGAGDGQAGMHGCLSSGILP
mmetsp:Transcript_78098/g.205028  ORF Transcript_78098/g.205028 Transcript_78098/m.205028 type:complete len:287 (-) Transcript_78098:240-1100(-)